MNRQDYYYIITKVFKYDELTEHKFEGDTYYTLNKWHPNKKSFELPSVSCVILIILDILKLDSGNFNTGESHYILDKIKLSEYLSYESYNDIITPELIDSIMSIYREMILDELLGD